MSPARAVRFDRYGGLDELYLAEIPMPQAGPGEVVVRVRAAAANPLDSLIRTGAMHELFPATFPSGQGSDLAGVVTAAGAGVRAPAVGDEVLGWVRRPSAQATHVAVPAELLVPKPAALGWAEAGSLHMAGTTGYAAVRAAGAEPGETVAVSAAAGGVGSLAVQLLARRGVRVLGIASAGGAGWLSRHGAVPVRYGDGLAERLTEAAPDGIDAVIDLFGDDYLDLAVELGVPAARMVTVVAAERAGQLGATFAGRYDAANSEVLNELAELAGRGGIEVPIAARYSLERVADAFAELERRHTHGKIVIVP